MLIITDTSVKKNNVATSISYICRGQEIITKLVYYAINITFIEAELFAIRYRINHIVILLISSLSLIPFQLLNRYSIYLFTHFNCTLLLYLMILGTFSTETLMIQLLFGIVLIISSGLHIYQQIKSQNIYLRVGPVLPNKMSWELSRKEKCDIIINKQQIYFQASKYKRRNFLELNNNDH